MKTEKPNATASSSFTPFPDFLTIYNSFEHSQRVVFPRSYNKYYPKPLPQTAVIKRPEGNFWTVKWTISQDETISFQDGVQKFVKDNDLIDRDFILFTYDGYRSFWVRISRNGVPLMMKAPIKIQEISDDEDVTTGDDDNHRMEKEEDDNADMIISLSLGSSDDLDHHDDDDDDYDDDDYEDDKESCEVNSAHASSKKGRVNRKTRLASSDVEEYLDDPRNPFFIPTSSCLRRMLVIVRQVVRDYALNFGHTIKFIDGFGKLKAKVGHWQDRVVVYKWDEIYKRNNAKPGDEIICEIKREDDVVRAIKVHFVKK